MRKLLEQLAHRAVAAIALVLQRHLMSTPERRQRRENVPELRPDVVVQGGEAGWLQALDVLVERIDEH